MVDLILKSTLLLVVAANRGAVAVRLTGTRTGTGTVTGTGNGTTDLIWDFVIMHLPVLLMHLPVLSTTHFYPECGYLTFCCMLSSESTKLLKY